MASPRGSKSLIAIPSLSEIFDEHIQTDNQANTSVSHHHSEDQAKPTHSSSHLSLQSALPPKHQVFIGNLKHDVPDRSIISKLKKLFISKADLSIPDFRFTLFQRDSKKHPRKYGFITFANQTDERKAYQLDGIVDPDFVIPGLKLNVTKRLSVRNRITKWNKITFNGRRCLVNRSKSDTLLQALAVKPNDVKDNTSQRKKEFFYGQYLQTENRVIEYKRGSGNYLKNMLISHVRKYVCAFLNSEGGRLMIGVDDTCKVYGISCTRKQEDIARCQIDSTIRNFQPHVSPHMYMVEFIPVKLVPNDIVELDSIDPLLKVLEVSVMKQNALPTLYTTDKENVFLRRDGSVEGPLRTSQVIEWCRTYFCNNAVNNLTKLKSPTCQCFCESKKGQLIYSTNDISEKLEEITLHQTDVLKQLEENLLEGHVQLKLQVKQLQELIERKENRVKELSHRLEKANSQLEKLRTQSKQNRFISFSCNIL